MNLSNTERLILVRSGLEVCSWLLSDGEYVFMRKLFKGKTLGEAAEAATLIQKDFNLAEKLALVFQRGTVVGININ